MAETQRLPAQNFAAAEPMMRSLIAGGPAAISQLVKQIGQRFGDPDGVQATYALHGLVHYAARPGAGDERKVVAQTLAAELKQNHSVDLKSFICQQLQLCGDQDQVPALSPLLADERLCEPAAQALGAIGGAKAAAALREALPGATGRRRATIINALGRLGDSAAADKIRQSLADADPDLQTVAMYAAGNAGDLQAADALLKAAAGQPSYQRSQAIDGCLRLARRAAADGKTAQAEELLGKLSKMALEWQERCAVLDTLAEVLGPRASANILEALSATDLRIRAAAARIALHWARRTAAAAPGEAAKVLKRLPQATKEQAVVYEAEKLLKTIKL